MFVKELEITLENGMKISGELDLPERQGQWKTIILFHGSGPSDRHATVESMGGIVSRNFDLLSEGFVKARYAVFRYDKRENYDIEIIIRDAREVTRFVSGLSEVEGILFYGWSEGVRVCTTLVSDFPNAQALILQSGIAEGWSSYFSYILRELTVEKLKELDNNSDSILEISDFLNCIPDSTSISFSLYLLILGTDKEGNMKFNEELDPEGKGRFSIIDNWIPLADEIVADPTTLIRFAENAPGETWAGILDDIKKIQLPILVLHGLNDGWISPVEAVQIAKAARNNADIILFKGLGHSLSKVSSPLKDEGGTIEDELMGILGKGSDRSRLLSKNLNVPMYTDIKEINQNVDAACVVVPNAAGGGNGANIAKSILAKGIPTLLEHPAHEVEIVNCIRESGSAAFMLNPFYRYIKPIRDFLEAAQIISKHAHLINASLECAIHVLYDGIDILGCALGGLSTWKLGNVAESYTTSMAGGGNRVISGIIGMVPVTFIVNTNVDRNDIDHPLHLYHRIELTFSTGRLCLVNTHGPVIWLPFLHMPRDEYGTLSINVEEEVNIPSGVTIGNVMLPSVKETFEQIWPDAVKKALEILFKQNRTEKMSMAQYQIYVSKLWSEICQKVGYMNIVDYDNFGDIKSIFYDLEKRHLIKKENDGIE